MNHVIHADTGEWQSGFFDVGSFDEILHGWAKTVVVGRARLGGIPVGVVAVETRSVAVDIPADPADLDSEEREIHRAGQVLVTRCNPSFVDLKPANYNNVSSECILTYSLIITMRSLFTVHPHPFAVHRSRPHILADFAHKVL